MKSNLKLLKYAMASLIFLFIVTLIKARSFDPAHFGYKWSILMALLWMSYVCYKRIDIKFNSHEDL